IAPSSRGGTCPVRVQKAVSRAGISPGARKLTSSGSTKDTKGGAASALLVSSSYDSSCPVRDQVRRHSWTSHRPMMFFNRRVVPRTPPSLVKLYLIVSTLITGRATSTPRSDHVPELR